MEGRADMACHLIGQHGCSVKNKDGKSLLYYAIISKKAPIEQKEDLVEYLIAEGADRNFKDKHGNNVPYPITILFFHPAPLLSLLFHFMLT